ncbi:ABC transporter ATP-binding protein [Enterococcus olivae]
MTATVILETKDLEKQYTIKKKTLFNKHPETLTAVNKVSLKIHTGETLGIVGESGCGKSTFARLVTRLITPTGGQVFFEEEELTKLSQEEIREKRKDIQMIFQDPYASLDPRKRILAILTEPLEIHGIGTAKEREEQALEMLEKVGLQRSYATRFPHEFSGGQCQRINIARALMLRPKLVICDEPVSALDVSIQAQVLNLLLDLQEEFHLTYVFISHDLNVVRYFCDKIAVMYMGEVVEYGDAEKIYQQPEHAYTKKLLTAIPKSIKTGEE